jgi:hypothetical protein
MQRRLDLQQCIIDELQNTIQTIQNTYTNTQTPNTRPRKKPHSSIEPNSAFGTQTTHISLQSTNTNTSMDEECQPTPINQYHQSNTENAHNQTNFQSNDSTSPDELYTSYNSNFHNQDSIALSPINIDNTSIGQNGENANSQHTMIDLTTQSPNQDDSAIAPRNLSSSFPTSLQEIEDNTNQDLGNQYQEMIHSNIGPIFSEITILSFLTIK